MWCHRPNLHILHVEPFLELVARHGDGYEEDVDDDAECFVVWTSVVGDAVGRGRVGVWGGRGRGVDTEEGEEGEGEESEAGEWQKVNVERKNLFVGWSDFWTGTI